MEPRGWHDRGYLPHRDVPLCTQSINFRLTGSLPKKVVREAMRAIQQLPEDQRRRAYLAAIDRYLDFNQDIDFLRRPQIAESVEQALLNGADRAFLLHAWCIMPNHVHALITPLEGWSLGQIVKAWKKSTGKRAQSILGRQGSFWAKDYFDRMIRDERHFGNQIAYIENNPVKAGLCDDRKDWPFGSARWRD